MRGRGVRSVAVAAFVVLGALPAQACRIGGPSGDPAAYVAFPVDASSQPESGAGDDLGDGDDGGDPSSSGGSEASSDDGTGSVSDDSGSVGDDGDLGRDGQSCTPAVAPAICDPVHNTGCPNVLQQCDIDPTQTTKATGTCVFGSPMDAGACLMSAFTESCPVHFACIATACRQPCYCDTDCAAGQCCTDTSSAPGWSLCGSCH
ncbi:MAG TPA: hypothetical protein VH044_06970 [Polyangiaceae bacterium]|nr:hypothetical protein [Polyangiaceae bacterium]